MRTVSGRLLFWRPLKLLNPGTHGGVPGRCDFFVAGPHHIFPRAMSSGFGIHGIDDCHLVKLFCQCGKMLTDLGTGDAGFNPLGFALVRMTWFEVECVQVSHGTSHIEIDQAFGFATFTLSLVTFFFAGAASTMLLNTGRTLTPSADLAAYSRNCRRPCPSSFESKSRISMPLI